MLHWQECVERISGPFHTKTCVLRGENVEIEYDNRKYIIKNCDDVIEDGHLKYSPRLETYEARVLLEVTDVSDITPYLAFAKICFEENLVRANGIVFLGAKVLSQSLFFLEILNHPIVRGGDNIQ